MLTSATYKSGSGIVTTLKNRCETIASEEGDKKKEDGYLKEPLEGAVIRPGP